MTTQLDFQSSGAFLPVGPAEDLRLRTDQLLRRDEPDTLDGRHRLDLLRIGRGEEAPVAGRDRSCFFSESICSEGLAEHCFDLPPLEDVLQPLHRVREITVHVGLVFESTSHAERVGASSPPPSPVGGAQRAR